jgi:hypothetical protein
MSTWWLIYVHVQTFTTNFANDVNVRVATGCELYSKFATNKEKRIIACFLAQKYNCMWNQNAKFAAPARKKCQKQYRKASSQPIYRRHRRFMWAKLFLGEKAEPPPPPPPHAAKAREEPKRQKRPISLLLRLVSSPPDLPYPFPTPPRLL